MKTHVLCNFYELFRYEHFKIKYILFYTKYITHYSLNNRALTIIVITKYKEMKCFLFEFGYYKYRNHI